MIIASWLVALDPRLEKTARARLGEAPGREIRDKKGSRWIVLLTESSEDLDAMRQALLATPGVEAADPVASFDDRETATDIRRWES